MTGHPSRMATIEASTENLRYIDSDGHILEHPTGMPDYAPAEFRDRIWHIETDESGQEWLHYNGQRGPANDLAAAGTAGLSDEDRARSFRGELRYTEVRPAAYNAKARLQDMDTDGIDLAVLYPTMLLGLQSFARRRLRRGAGPRVQRLVLGPCAGGRRSPVRCRRGAADARARRRCARSRPRSGASPSCRAWCRCSCGRTRRSTGGRSTTPSTTRSGTPRRTPGCRSRCTRSCRPTSRARASVSSSRGRAAPTGGTRTIGTGRCGREQHRGA